MTDKDRDWSDEEPGEIRVDSRISEMVDYADTAVELILNAAFLLDEWGATYLQARAKTYEMVKRCGMTSEQKFMLVMGESGGYEDDEYGGQEAFGFLAACRT
jgi:hypothetical protein